MFPVNHLPQWKSVRKVGEENWFLSMSSSVFDQNYNVSRMKETNITHIHVHTKAHTHTTAHTFVHANSDIMHGCPLRFIIKALSGCAGSEGENMNRIKQIVWCVKDRHSSSKVLKLLLPMDSLGMKRGARKECFSLLLSSAFLLIMSFQTIASLFMQGPSVSVSNVN